MTLNLLPRILRIFLIMLLTVNSVWAQLKVTGTVSDENGDPLPGVNIIEKGTTSGTSTNAEGHYELGVSSGAAILAFSFVGYLSQDLPIENRSRIDINLSPDTKQLGEIVVVGYGTQKRSDLTGSIASADIEAFRESPNVNIMQSLQGSVPGVQVGQVNQAGQEPSISIRGQTTLSGSTSPLIVVDGIIFRGRIGDLNPADIASVDVLKDASSKAIYGAQASNGVILITTKSGTADTKPVITYSGSMTTQSPTVNAKLLNREEFLEKVRDIEYRKSYLAPDYTQPNPDWDYTISELRSAHIDGLNRGTNFDWWDALTNNAFISDHLVSIAGRSGVTNYYLSGGHTNQRGFVKNDNYKRNTVRINLDIDVTKWLKVGINSFGSFADLSGNYPNMRNITGLASPLIMPWDDEGNLIINPNQTNIVNPFLDMEADDKNKLNRITGNFYTLVKIPGVKGLSYRLNYSNNYRWDSRFYSNPYDNGLNGLAYKTNSSQSDMMLDNIVTYDEQFGDHHVNLTMIAGYNEINQEHTRAEALNYSNLVLSYNSLQQGVNQFVTSSAWKEAYLYQMGRINYNYKRKYMLTATIRRDGFSGFSQNNKTGYFPSIGMAWVISNEPFYKINRLEMLKFRASYGKNGNQTSRYSSLAMVTSGVASHYVFGDGAATSLGQSPSSLANNNLTWETTSGINLGLDFGAFKNRITGSLEYYATTTTNLLWNVELPQMSGFSSIQSNLGRIENRGFELLLTAGLIKGKSFSWDLTTNFSTNRNKITSLLGIDRDGDGKEDDLIASGLFIGNSIGTVYSYEVGGIWQLGDEIPAGYNPGTYRLIDQNGDGMITAAGDRVILGRTEPAYRFGIQNTFRYRNFTLRSFINSVQGGKNGYLGANHAGSGATTGNSQAANWFSFADYWSPRNPDGKYPPPWGGAQILPPRYFSRNFVRLQDVSLSYQLPESVFKKIGLNNFKIFLSGKNLATLTKWDGWDPETGQGIGWSADAFPVMKAYTIGVDFSF